MKRLAVIIVSILIILIAGFSIAFLNAHSVLAHIISQKTELPVSIKKMTFHKDSFKIHDLTLFNPKEARSPIALKTETIKIEAPYVQYIEDPIVIDLIHIHDTYVNIQIYNKDQSEGNWHTIIKNMAKDHNSPFSIERSTTIKKLVLTNVKIDLLLANGSVHHLSPIDRLEFENINTEKGIPIQEISEIIVQKMMGQIFFEKGLKAILNAPATLIKGVLPFL